MAQITKEELADMINGREYSSEITNDERRLAKENHLVVVFGRGDDYMLLSGATNDEIPAWDGGTAYFNEHGLLLNECDDDNCPYYKRLIANAAKVDAVWGPKDPDCSWLMKSDIPHATFDIFEDGDLYCRGLVFNLKELTANGDN